MSQKEIKTYNGLYGLTCAFTAACLNFLIVTYLPTHSQTLVVISSFLAQGFGYGLYRILIWFDPPKVIQGKKRLKHLKKVLNDPNIPKADKEIFKKEYVEINKEILNNY